jgi:hypothetical protein
LLNDVDRCIDRSSSAPAWQAGCVAARQNDAQAQFASRDDSASSAVSNARLAPPPGGLSLDRNGFELHKYASALTVFFDPAAVEGIYYPESEALLKRWTGAKRVVIFDHTLNRVTSMFSQQFDQIGFPQFRMGLCLMPI